MIGQVVHHYRIEEELGRGGWATVYRGLDLRLDRPVAIKVLNPRYAVDPRRIERFRNEAKALARLRHDNIVLVHDYIETKDANHIIVMEYVEAGALIDRIRKHGALKEGQALHIFRDVVHAIGYAHENGVIHRDINPHNIMLSTRGGAKVTDFGIARMLGGARLTQTGMVLGTLHYMAPEQLERAEVNEQTDVYSMGATLYQMVTGRKPFQAFEHDQAALMDEICLGKWPDPREFVPDLSGNTVEIIRRCMAQNPRRRFARAEQILDVLDRSAPARSLTESWLIRTGDLRRTQPRRWLPWVVLGMVFLGLVLAALVTPNLLRRPFLWAWGTAVLGVVVCAVIILVRYLLATAGLRSASSGSVPHSARDGSGAVTPSGESVDASASSTGTKTLVDAPRLVVVAGDGHPPELAVEDNQIVTLGRSNENALWFDEEVVSRAHAFVKRDGRDLIVTDLRSTNGTHVNGQCVRRAILRAGDRIELGGSDAALEVQWD